VKKWLDELLFGLRTRKNNWKIWRRARRANEAWKIKYSGT